MSSEVLYCERGRGRAFEEATAAGDEERVAVIRSASEGGRESEGRTHPVKTPFSPVDRSVTTKAIESCV